MSSFNEAVTSYRFSIRFRSARTNKRKQDQDQDTGRYLNASGNGNDDTTTNSIIATGKAKYLADIRGSRRFQAAVSGFGGYILGDDRLPVLIAEELADDMKTNHSQIQYEIISLNYQFC